MTGRGAPCSRPAVTATQPGGMQVRQRSQPVHLSQVHTGAPHWAEGPAAGGLGPSPCELLVCAQVAPAGSAQTPLHPATPLPRGPWSGDQSPPTIPLGLGSGQLTPRPLPPIPSPPPSPPPGYREGFLWKRGRDNGQFLSRKFVLTEREGALKYFNRSDVSRPGRGGGLGRGHGPAIRVGLCCWTLAPGQQGRVLSFSHSLGDMVLGDPPIHSWATAREGGDWLWSAGTPPSQHMLGGPVGWGGRVLEVLPQTAVGSSCPQPMRPRLHEGRGWVDQMDQC